MIKRIKIQNYKSLRDVDVTLQHLVVLFGPNASGKSNFLDALQLLSRMTTSRTLKDAFEPPYRGAPLESFSFGPEGIQGLLKERSVSFFFEADIELSEAVVSAVNHQIREMRSIRPSGEETSEQPSLVRERNLRYRIEVEILPKSGILRVKDEYLAALNDKGEPSQKRKPFIERMGERLHLRMEGQAHPTYYQLYLDHTILSLPLYPPHYPHLVATRQEMASWFLFYFEPRERMRAANPVKEVRHIGLMGEELASFLNTLQAQNPKQFAAIKRSLKTLLPSVTDIEVGPNSIGEVELKLREGDTLIPARILSEGTLRLLGLLALVGVQQPPSLIGFEEPENGIHPRRIELVAEYLKTRARPKATQIIVTTHSPILPDLLPPESLYVCRRSSAQTCIAPFESMGGLFQKQSIDAALTDDADAPTPISERILRGDFDA